MIQTQTILKVSDNSGAKTVKCIKILGGFKRKYAVHGNIIIVAVQNLRNKSKLTSKVKKKEIYKALIIRTKIKDRTSNGFSLTFNNNSVILINKQGNFIGTRIMGSTSKTVVLNNKKNKKMSSLMSKIV